MSYSVLQVNEVHPTRAPKRTLTPFASTEETSLRVLYENAKGVQHLLMGETPRPELPQRSGSLPSRGEGWGGVIGVPHIDEIWCKTPMVRDIKRFIALFGSKPHPHPLSLVRRGVSGGRV